MCNSCPEQPECRENNEVCDERYESDGSEPKNSRMTCGDCDTFGIECVDEEASSPACGYFRERK
jgi:hypothetical protein